MKPQDILFIIIFLGLLWKKNPTWAACAGLLFIALSVPLFHLQIFFTAERFIIYAGISLLLSILFHLLREK